MKGCISELGVLRARMLDVTRPDGASCGLLVPFIWQKPGQLPEPQEKVGVDEGAKTA